MATKANREIWTVRVFERPRRGQVHATRYHVIAGSKEEAVKLVRAEHELRGAPETQGARYTATAYGGVHLVDRGTIPKALAEQSIEAGIA